MRFSFNDPLGHAVDQVSSITGCFSQFDDMGVVPLQRVESAKTDFYHCSFHADISIFRPGHRFALV